MESVSKSLDSRRTIAKLRDSVKFDDERSSKLLSESKEASPEIMDTKQRRRRVSEAKKKKGFGVSESKEAEGVSLRFFGAIYGVTLLKRGKNNIIRIKGQKSITSDFPFNSPA